MVAVPTFCTLVELASIWACTSGSLLPFCSSWLKLPPDSLDRSDAGISIHGLPSCWVSGAILR